MARDHLASVFDRHPRAATALAATVAATVAGVLGGPIAGVVAIVYTATAGSIVRSRRRAAGRARASDRALDAVARCAAELRVGADPATTLAQSRAEVAGAHHATDEATRLFGRMAAAYQVAETTGAPLADLLDRLEADARTTTRLRRAAMAQASGAQATGWLLAALPGAGIALGYGIGVDPLHVLLHTRLGAVFTVLALGLQVAGLGWTARLSAAILGAA